MSQPSLDYTLCLVADAGFAGGRDLLALAEQAVAGGATLVQLRAKGFPDRDLVELGRWMAERLARLGVPLIVNDRADIALACGAAGVHLGQDDLPIEAARRISGPEAVIGVSVNTVEEALRAQAEGASYLGAGPVFPTETKDTRLPAIGPDGLRDIKRAVKIPVVGIGGITASNAPELAGTGIDGIAVISAILASPDARQAAEKLKQAFKG